MPGRLLQIRTGKHPHEILVIAATILIGTLGATAPERISGAIAAEFLWPWAMVYWVAMAGSGLITLWGILNHKIEGLLVERAGLTLQATMFAIYIYAVSQHTGLAGLVSMILPAAFAIGNLARCWQIRSDLKLLKAYLKDHPGEKVR